MLLREVFISLSVDLTFGSGTCVIRINRASILKKAVRKTIFNHYTAFPKVFAFGRFGKSRLYDYASAW